MTVLLTKLLLLIARAFMTTTARFGCSNCWGYLLLFPGNPLRTIKILSYPSKRINWFVSRFTGGLCCRDVVESCRA